VIVRTGRGPYLQSVALGAFVAVLSFFLLFVIIMVVALVLLVAVLALGAFGVAIPAALVLGAVGMLRLEEPFEGPLEEVSPDSYHGEILGEDF